MAIQTDKTLEIQEEEIKEDLFNSMVDNISERININESSALTDEALATYFIENIYEPLLSEGKEISKIFVKPLVV